MTAHPHENTKMGGQETNNVVSLALWNVYTKVFSLILSFDHIHGTTEAKLYIVVYTYLRHA